MKHLFWLIFIFMFSINKLSSTYFIFQDSVYLWLLNVFHCQKCFEWQPLSSKQQNSVTRCLAFLLTENSHKDLISGSYLYEGFLELIIKNCMHILWRFSSLFNFVTPSRNRMSCFRNKVNMKEILSNLFSTFKLIRQNSFHLNKEFKIKREYSEKYIETLSNMTSTFAAVSYQILSLHLS